MTNPAAQQLGRLGGQARSEAKRAANRAKMIAYWADVRAGRRAAPGSRRKTTALDTTGARE
jgi:hypothetical protein